MAYPSYTSFNLLVFVLILLGCQPPFESNEKAAPIEHPIIGKWIRNSHDGAVSFDFKNTGSVDGDMGMDGSIDVVAKFEITNDTIRFLDKKGFMCNGYGTYKMYLTDYYVAFDLVDDMCGGRIKTTMGFWTKPGYKELLADLDQKIVEASSPELLLNRARIHMAMGYPDRARPDFDHVISTDSTDARVFINRAGTRFPHDLEGVVYDCNKALSIDPANKNAYFMRGLAQYDLGEMEKGCEDFQRAIDLGFRFLEFAESRKCSSYWN